ncbi:MAG: DNA (cytosine-5-)-methyltransferase [Chloroflexi bacterium]|nr:DNA (cytosine-5-)-methyltransferase [Chloroflexota bacterium]
MPKNTNSRPTFVDLFAGCGGLSLGLEQAGFKPIFVNEINKDALETYQFNRKDEFPYLSEEMFFAHDVKELVLDSNRLEALKTAFLNFHGVDVKSLENGLDLLVGGPPCQGYSGIGHRRSYSVDKEQLPSNHLYQDMAFLISQLKPKLFLFENVRGLLNSRWTQDGSKGEIWRDVQKTFHALDGYSIRSQLVFAKNYGVPQNRPRILMVGIRNDLGFKFDDENDDSIAAGLLPHPDEYSVAPPHLEELLSDLIDLHYQNGGSTQVYPFDPMNEIQSYLRMNREGHVASKGQPITEHDYSNHSPHVVRKFQHMIEHDGEIPDEYKTKKFSQKVLKSKWTASGPNITVTSLADDYVHWAQPRSLTVRECARIQTFPDWYEFKGKRTTGGIRRAGNPRESNHEREVPKYTQIGNAVPVRLAHILGQHFRSILKK